MRELRFRVWIKDEKRYYDESDEGSYMIVPNGNVTYTSEVYEENGEWCKDTTSATSDVIVEQYTGLKDKNGKEIYEGDIVDYNDDGECIGVVEYDAPEFCLNADATNWARMFLKGAPHQRVIGNIHENPELVEGEK